MRDKTLGVLSQPSVCCILCAQLAGETEGTQRFVVRVLTCAIDKAIDDGGVHSNTSGCASAIVERVK